MASAARYPQPGGLTGCYTVRRMLSNVSRRPPCYPTARYNDERDIIVSADPTTITSRASFLIRPSSWDLIRQGTVFCPRDKLAIGSSMDKEAFWLLVLFLSR